MTTILTFYPDGTFRCDGLNETRKVRIGGKPAVGEPTCQECPRFAKCGMSHTSTVATSIKDLNAIKAACKALGLNAPKVGTHEMYDGKEVTGVAVHLKDWQFPIVINQKTGEIHYDNFGGKWGKEEELNKFKQAYAVAKAKIIARQHGYFVKQFTLPNGTVRLTVTM